MTIGVYFILTLLGIYAAVFFLQEKLIFWPTKLNKNYQFNFDQKFEEINVKSYDGTILNGLLFKTADPKGLIFYLHGNGGCLRSWGEVASTYTDLNYDIFMLDYRGYGKSEGTIHSEEQLSRDAQMVYDEVNKHYPENRIIIIGYSLGSGLATKLASTNNPGMLILQAPFYSLKSLIMRRAFYAVPPFILKYRFESHRYISRCKMPIVIFHGTDDEVVPYRSSLLLKEQLKPDDILITLPGQGHSKITNNQKYKDQLKKILQGN